ncbi:MAG TPA: DUF4395 domain-containing protein [bacterium]|jgi:hypothetical protein|nr:MAG: hypothetical protein BWX82_00677 [Parcubacteria group bacterium ADurb.Bin115]HNU81785.1 DUF4395 domain-containing protein [bacterium]HPW05961.1 DUF4395 domain-containing protein [bacterium]HPY99677.1 DUF4395 domain-containing protein [bacterium]HQB76351.1 DUF4395 domain-containing protein [bacterium]
MHKIFQFGEKMEAYQVPVLNEREARAAAGILFLFAMISLSNVLLAGNFTFIKIFIIAFTVEFLIRVFVNPKYAPVMILGRLAVSGQKPEYTGAPQKRFAWSLGLGLALIMVASLILNIIPFTFSCLICFICVILLFLESAFGICVGCKLYNLLTGNKAQLCPGGVCEARKKEDIQKVNYWQILVLLVFGLIMFAVSRLFIDNQTQATLGGCPLGSQEESGSCPF